MIRMYVFEESDRGIVPIIIRTRTEYRRRRVRREGCGSRRITFPFDTFLTLSGTARVHGWASVRTSATFGRHSSAIRASCANERSCGSARGGEQQWLSLPRPSSRVARNPSGINESARRFHPHGWAAGPSVAQNQAREHRCRLPRFAGPQLVGLV